MRGSGNQCGIRFLLEGSFQIVEAFGDVVSIAYFIAQILIQLADRKINSVSRLKAAQVSFSNGSDSDDQNVVFGFHGVA